MAKKTTTTTKINPNTSSVSAKKPSAEKKAETSNRTPAAHWKAGKDKGERCNGLEWPLTEEQKKNLQFRWADYCVLEGKAKVRFGARQFRKPSFYHYYMADKHNVFGQLYADAAKELAAGPDVWVSSANRKATRLELENKVLELRAELMQLMVEAATSGNMEEVATLQAKLAECTLENLVAEQEAQAEEQE